MLFYLDTNHSYGPPQAWTKMQNRHAFGCLEL
jgi:hypothetical protein